MDYFYLHIKDDDKLIATRSLSRDEFNTIEGDGAQFIINAYSKFFNLDISDYHLSRLMLDEGETNEDALSAKRRLTIKIYKEDLIKLRDSKLGEILNG
jgi:hypothetical protein